jgi:arsenite methyltransferase
VDAGGSWNSGVAQIHQFELMSDYPSSPDRDGKEFAGMAAGMQFDEATSRRIEAAYTTPDVVEQRRIVIATLDLNRGEHVLDIGSGPGFLACEMGAAVGPNGSVIGIDPSESMLAIARERSLINGSAPVQFKPGGATALPFPEGSFDAVTSTQVYEYVEDIPTALAEAHRVLRPGGRLLVLDTDWDSIVWRSGDPDRMRRVLTAWDEHLADPHLPQRITRSLRDAGFAVTLRSTIPLLNAGYDTNTFSAGLIGFIAAFVPERAGVTRDDATAWSHDLVALGPDYFFSLNRYLFMAVKQQA